LSVAIVIWRSKADMRGDARGGVTERYAEYARPAQSYTEYANGSGRETVRLISAPSGPTLAPPAKQEAVQKKSS
jgi:hypothetical protein